MDTQTPLQQQIDSLLSFEPDLKAIYGNVAFSDTELATLAQPFTPFDAQSKKQALQESDFADPPTEDLQELVELAKRIARVEGIEFAQEWLKGFIVHNAATTGIALPPFLQRHPYLLHRQSNRQIESRESRLNWFREDIFLSEHHEHWHALYGENLIPGRLKDRQGELFLYMHQQMLARYNTERIAAGLNCVIPFPQISFDEPIAEGYDPGLNGRFRARAAGAGLVDESVIKRSFLTEWLQDLRELAINRLDHLPELSHIENKEDVLGNVLTGNGRLQGLHNLGNIHGMLHKQLGNIDPGLGVMRHSHVSTNDPIFYRWHRCLDDLSFSYQQRQPPNDFVNDAPAVFIRSTQQQEDGLSQTPDIILSFQHQLERRQRNNETLEAVGERLFGASNWDKEFSGNSETTTNQLFTHVDSMQVPLPKGEGETAVSFLDQKHEFVTFIRVQNELARPQTITARLWLVAKDDQRGRLLSNNRRLWMELDTFRVQLAANERKVICRPAWESSIIKKVNGIGLRPATALSLLKPQPVRYRLGDEDYCDCGWPYNLLLPKGTPDGMAFRLMVMFTKDDVLLPSQPSSCGSVRLCGSKQSLYPDKKRMGYPFNRPFVHSIEETLAKLGNTAVRDIQIVFQP